MPEPSGLKLAWLTLPIASVEAGQLEVGGTGAAGISKAGGPTQYVVFPKIWATNEAKQPG